MKICTAILSFLIITLGQNQFSNVPLDSPFASFTAPPVIETKISNKTIATFRSGDFVHPTFSPDGKTRRPSSVRRDLRIRSPLDTDNRKTSVLFDSKRAEKYATYKAFVADMSWRSPKRLEVVVSDGDVDSTRLIFDPYTRRLLRERHEGYDEAEAEPMSPMYKKTRQQAVSLFPAFPPDVLDNALMNSALVIPDKGIVLQKHYAGHDNNIWFLDFQSKL